MRALRPFSPFLALLALLAAPGSSSAQTGDPPSAAVTQPAPQPDQPGLTAAPAPSPAAPPSVEPGPVPAAAKVPATPGPDLSPWAMFLNADIVVKAVMLGLAFASVVTWTVWLAKRLQLAAARLRAVRSVRALMKAGGLADLAAARERGPLAAGPVAALVHAAEHERERSAELAPEGVKERAAIALARIEARAARTINRGTGVVATIGSTAPFVGLFGTVWGIMNAFVGISRSHTTNLAVVAPGIAEALLATAIGLVAAVPAVVIYNGLVRAIAGYRAILSDASAEVMRHLSRDLDRHVRTPAE